MGATLPTGYDTADRFLARQSTWVRPARRPSRAGSARRLRVMFGRTALGQASKPVVLCLGNQFAVPDGAYQQCMFGENGHATTVAG